MAAAAVKGAAATTAATAATTAATTAAATAAATTAATTATTKMTLDRHSFDSRKVTRFIFIHRLHHVVLHP